MNYIQIITAILGSSAITVLITSWFNKRKTSAEAADILNKSTLEWASELKKEITDLKSEIQKLNSENFELRNLILELKADRAAAQAQFEANKRDSTPVE